MKRNINFVGVRGGNICFLLPPKPEMSKEEALEFAAWIVCLSGDFELADFKKVFEEVCSS